MSMQVRRACQVLDMLRAGRQLTASELSAELDFDEAATRQLLRVLAQTGWAKDVGVRAGSHPGSKPRVYGAGPKLVEAASV